MKTRRQWVLYRIEGDGEKKTKVPYRPNGKHASTKNPKTWRSFDEVVNAYENGGFDGIGFVFTTEDPYAGVDLDDCRDPATGEITPEAQEIIAKLASYAEVSVSGTGVHIIVCAKVAAGRKTKGASRSTTVGDSSR
jgi:putative DNA primase/helicase